MLDKLFSSTRSDSVVVIGLGRFGASVAESLIDMGHEVLGLDEDASLVQNWSDRLTHVAQTDSTNIEACLLYTSPSPRDQRGSRMPSSA